MKDVFDGVRDSRRASEQILTASKAQSLIWLLQDHRVTGIEKDFFHRVSYAGSIETHEQVLLRN